MTAEEIKSANRYIFAMCAEYLNNHEHLIDKESIMEMKSTGLGTEEAFRMLLSYAFGLDEVENPHDREIYRCYFTDMVRCLRPEDYSENAYYKNIIFGSHIKGKWKLEMAKYKAYEGFVCGDILSCVDGRMIPRLGFFENDFPYPAVYENGRLWMSVVPNEIETMHRPISECRGRVVTLGLGLGYFAYMASMKDEVTSVTAVERDADVISLFREHILPQFEHPEKIDIIHSDAIEFLDGGVARDFDFDYLFADIWHDAGDGLPLYLKIKEYEKEYPNTKFSYWIEQSIKCYL